MILVVASAKKKPVVFGSFYKKYCTLCKDSSYFSSTMFSYDIINLKVVDSILYFMPHHNRTCILLTEENSTHVTRDINEKDEKQSSKQIF